MLPMGYPFLEFSLNDNRLRHHRDGEVEQFHHIVIGLVNKPLYFQNTNAIHSVLVRLHPWGLARIFAGSAQLNTFFDAGLIFQKRIEPLLEVLRSQPDQNRWKEVLDTFFLRYLRDRVIEIDERIAFAIRHILQKRGRISVVDLENQLFLSQRRLEQLFKAHLGLTPKAYVDLARFQSALALAHQYPNLTQLAIETGYYDQSHFIRHCKKFSGVSPSKLLHPGGSSPEIISNLYNLAFD
jgi:AraC-like DNA-binding protein